MTTPARPYHHGNLREALLRAAEEMLERVGAPGLTLRELSRELGVSHTSPLRHFANKQALLDGLAIRGFDRLDAVMSRPSRGAEKGFSARVTRLAKLYVGFQLKHPALCALMFEAKHRSDAPREVLAAGDRAFSHGPAIFAEAQLRGEVVEGDPARLSLVVFAALQGIVTISTDGKFKGISLDILVPEMMERIIFGMLPAPAKRLGPKKSRG